MKRIAVLIGVRGAGKTTLMQRVHTCAGVHVLTPSTTRSPREASEDDEYHFVDEWPPEEMAWQIQVGGHDYGMRRSEVEQIPHGHLGLTVFDPGNIGALEEFKKQWDGEIVTIGLDTISTGDEQARRVNHDHHRTTSVDVLNQQRAVVCNADVVLSGTEEEVARAMQSVVRLTTGRGGILCSEDIYALVGAGSLLRHADTGAIQPASYDLRIGDEVWCQGERVALTEQQPLFEIPPYSYAIVKAAEIAKLPRFLTGRFDLRVSLFFAGIILSNGPQVDPGYYGELFCVLFNGRGQKRGLRRGNHFATIEFCTTTQNTEGYSGDYQSVKGLLQFMDEDVASGPGGDIIERVEALADDSKVKIWGPLGLLLALVGILVTINFFVLTHVQGRADRALEEFQRSASRLIDAIDAEAFDGQEGRGIDRPDEGGTPPANQNVRD